VVEHPLGKGEVVSSILTGSTSPSASQTRTTLRTRRGCRDRCLGNSVLRNGSLVTLLDIAS
jgi:hypothetical protein